MVASHSSFDDRPWRVLPGPLHAEILTIDHELPDKPVILLHGFTQTRRSWDPLLAAFDATTWPTRTVIRVDLPGHGGSTDVIADLSTTADLVVDTCGRGTYFGYSMGGRVALHAALRHPDRVSTLITIGATPGIEDPEERTRRRLADESMADEIERIGSSAFIEQWLSQPMFAGLPQSDADLLERRSNSPSGLAMSLRHAGTGTQAPLWAKLVDLEMPILLLAGSRDTKFAEIADRMAGEIGSNARSVRISRSGHSAHLEQPALVAAETTKFLESMR